MVKPLKMTKIKICIFFLCFLSFSCARKTISTENSTSQTELNTLLNWMTGTFDSSLQASQDSSYFDISLTMVPMWENDPSYKWLYVEQAVSANKMKPYRQRVYRLEEYVAGRFESKVYTLENPKEFIHVWNNPSLFEKLTPSDLIEREGCSVFLNKVKNSFSGSTFEHDCKSTMRGASSATSTVQITHDRIVSWDQGWDSEKNQVWGAEKGGYVFIKLNTY